MKLTVDQIFVQNEEIFQWWEPEQLKVSIEHEHVEVRKGGLLGMKRKDAEVLEST